MDAILLDFEKAYGSHPNVTFVTQASNHDLDKYKPSIKISKDESSIEFYIDIHLLNPIDPSIDAALIVAKADTKISFNVNDELLLWGTIQELKLSIIDFQPYYKTATTIDVINAKLTLVTPLMEAYANSLLDNGWKLPLPRNITKYILRQRVEARDGYLLIDGDADFTK